MRQQSASDSHCPACLGGAENNGKYLSDSGYSTAFPQRSLRGSSDFFDVFAPEYIYLLQMWCSLDAPLAADSGVWTGTLHQIVNTVWDFSDSQGPGHAIFTEMVYSNLTEWVGCTGIPRKLSDPGDWVVVNGWTAFWVAQDAYVFSNHSGRLAIWGVGPAIRGRNGAGRPRGVNRGTVDGSLQWTPMGECMLGCPGCGGTASGAYGTCRTLQPPHPGRTGMLP